MVQEMREFFEPPAESEGESKAAKKSKATKEEKVMPAIPVVHNGPFFLLMDADHEVLGLYDDLNAAIDISIKQSTSGYIVRIPELNTTLEPVDDDNADITFVEMVKGTPEKRNINGYGSNNW